jgi:hypothetical protein
MTTTVFWSIHSLQHKPDLTIQIPLLSSHDHVFCCHGVKIRHLKNRWLGGLLRKGNFTEFHLTGS